MHDRKPLPLARQPRRPVLLCLVAALVGSAACGAPRPDPLMSPAPPTTTPSPAPETPNEGVQHARIEADRQASCTRGQLPERSATLPKGACNSAGECHLCKVEVAGSNPARSTNLDRLIRGDLPVS